MCKPPVLIPSPCSLKNTNDSFKTIRTEGFTLYLPKSKYSVKELDLSIPAVFSKARGFMGSDDKLTRLWEPGYRTWVWH